MLPRLTRELWRNINCLRQENYYHEQSIFDNELSRLDLSLGQYHLCNPGLVPGTSAWWVVPMSSFPAF